MTWCRASNWGWLRNRLVRASESVLYTTIIYATTNLLAAGWNEVQNSANQRIFYHWRGFFGRTLMKPFECACQSIAESFDFEMFSTHDNIWLDGMDFLTMTKAPGCTQSYCICIMAWNNVDPGLKMPFIATAISDVENMPLGGILYAPSKLLTWQWVRGVTCYISYCPRLHFGILWADTRLRYRKGFVDECNVLWIEEKVLVQPEICQKASAQPPY